MSLYDKTEGERNENGSLDVKSVPAGGRDVSDVATDEDGQDGDTDANIVDGDLVEKSRLERALVRTIDWRLCTIAGILCSLNLLDSGIISSASVTT